MTIRSKFILWIFIVSIIPYDSLALSVDSLSVSTPVDTVKYWTFKSLSLVSVAQNAFVNWAAGGESSLTGKLGFEYDLKYKKNKFTLISLQILFLVWLVILINGLRKLMIKLILQLHLVTRFLKTGA